MTHQDKLALLAIRNTLLPSRVIMNTYQLSDSLLANSSSRVRLKEGEHSNTLNAIAAVHEVVQEDEL